MCQNVSVGKVPQLKRKGQSVGGESPTTWPPSLCVQDCWIIFKNYLLIHSWNCTRSQHRVWQCSGNASSSLVSVSSILFVVNIQPAKKQGPTYKQERAIYQQLHFFNDNLFTVDPIFLINRELPSLSRQYVTRLVFLEHPLSLAAVNSWAQLDSKSQRYTLTLTP